jgi:hypothetical protein
VGGGKSNPKVVQLLVRQGRPPLLGAWLAELLQHLLGLRFTEFHLLGPEVPVVLLLGEPKSPESSSAS